jgi:RNA polymerase sigma-70 factor (ECF subfamily)
MQPADAESEQKPNGNEEQSLADAQAMEVELIERAKLDPDAFSQLYERYLDRIYAYVYYRTGDARDAEDLTARVFYRALAHLPEFNQTGAPFVAWLYRIAHNLVANWHRDKTRHPELPLDVWEQSALPEGTPHAQAERAEAESKLLEAIRALPDDRQHLLLLKFVDGLSNLEIGKILGRSEGAIKSLYHRTLLSLREEMEKRGILDWE